MIQQTGAEKGSSMSFIAGLEWPRIEHQNDDDDISTL